MATNGFTVTTADGEELEAELALPDGGEPVAGAVVCHPHPRYGGDMWNPNSADVFRSLAQAGFATVRFNFRGTGRSTGTHGGGRAELADVVAAVEAVPDELPVVVCGYSFGGAVILAVDHPRIAAWVAVAAPLALVGAPTIGSDPRPKHFVVPEFDDFTRPDAVARATAAWVATSIEVVPGAQHFVVPGCGPRVAAFARSLFP